MQSSWLITIFDIVKSFAKTLGGWLTVLLLVLLLTVFLQHLRKGSAAEAMMGQRASAEALKNIKDESFLEKLSSFVHSLPSLPQWKTLRGTSVSQQVKNSFGNTALLTALSLAFSVVIGLGLLILSERGNAAATLLMRCANAVNTTPIFLLGIFLIWLFSFTLRFLPSGGDQSVIAFILPALAIGLKFGARLYLLLQNFMNELTEKTFVRRLEAFAVPKRRIFLHKLANCTRPFLIFWLIETAALFSGAVIVETLFSIHGLGSLLIFALLQYDIRLIFANLAVIATIVYITSVIQKQVAHDRFA